ncbi:MAG: DUF192 domain-containing protein [Oligosphaeraceae bacterium]|nr:DUF192 domain-containing protein [Oligosphaeraceae bacterium]
MKKTICLIMLICLTGFAGEEKKARPQYWPLQIGEFFFARLELALNDSERARGLMQRRELAEDQGMIFVFPQENELRFWMKNTPLPLDVIFLNRQGVVVGAVHMPPEPPQRQGESDLEYESRLPVYSSGAVAQIALELRSGMISQLGLQVGAKISLDIGQLLALLSEE